MATRLPLKERYEKESDSVNPARRNPPGTPPAFYYSCQKKKPKPNNGIVLIIAIRPQIN